MRLDHAQTRSLITGLGLLACGIALVTLEPGHLMTPGVTQGLAFGLIILSAVFFDFT